MKIILEIDEHMANRILNASCTSGQSFNEYISSVLEDHASSIMSDEKILEIAIDKAKKKNINDIFTLKELIPDLWESIESPKSFGRIFKKKSSHIVSYEGVTSSNKALYKRYDDIGYPNLTSGEKFESAW